MSGASNCTQRTDDFVSGSRTQTWTLAVLCDVPAVATATAMASAATAATSPTAITLRETFFTCSSPLFVLLNNFVLDLPGLCASVAR